jgi:hypothetical protein
MSVDEKWKFGDVILLRCAWHDRLWYASPATIVEDTDELIAFYWRAGTPNKKPPMRLTYKELLAPQQVPLVDGQWTMTDVLMLSIPGSGFGLMVMWASGHTRFNQWYVNLQDPLRRTPLGFDTMDRMLDIVITPDRTHWHWKDDAEFSEAVEHGVYSIDEAGAIREDRLSLIKTLVDEHSLFTEGWDRWMPPNHWPIPAVPGNWDEQFFH